MSLACEHLDVVVGKSRILHDVTLRVERGLNVLIGTNGSGKTTLLRALAGFQSCRGSVRLDDRDISRLSADARRRCGLVYRQQRPLVTPGMSAGDYLSLAFAGRAIDRVVCEAAELGFPRALARQVSDQPSVLAMSLRDRRLLELLTAATGESAAILLDEPLANAGAEAIEALGSFFDGLARVTALLLVEHRREFFAWLGTRPMQGSFLSDGTIGAPVGNLATLLADARVAATYGRL